MDISIGEETQNQRNPRFLLWQKNYSDKYKKFWEAFAQVAVFIELLDRMFYTIVYSNHGRLTLGLAR